MPQHRPRARWNTEDTLLDSRIAIVHIRVFTFLAFLLLRFGSNGAIHHSVAAITYLKELPAGLAVDQTDTPALRQLFCGWGVGSKAGVEPRPFKYRWPSGQVNEFSRGRASVKNARHERSDRESVCFRSAVSKAEFSRNEILEQGHDLSFVCGTNKETQKAGETKKFEDVQASGQRPTGDRGETIPGVWLGKR